MQRSLKVFIPICEANERTITQNDRLAPFVIDAYEYHLDSVKTQNLDIEKVNKGTETKSKGKTNPV